VYPNKLQFDDVAFVASSQLTANEVVGSMKRFGFAVIKSAMPGTEMTYFRQVLDDWYDTTRKCVEEGQIPKDEFQHRFLHGISGPLFHPHLQKFFDALCKTIFPDCAKAYLQSDDIAVPINHMLFRIRNDYYTQLEKGPSNPWKHGFHQDHDLIPSCFPLNAWFPLCKVDSSNTGLSFVLPYTQSVYSLPVDLDEYLGEHNGSIYTPELDPGDILLFDRYTIHGSFYEEQKQPRYSVEFRTGARTEAPVEYGPTLWRIWKYDDLWPSWQVKEPQRQLASGSVVTRDAARQMLLG
jgi:ectoine hydroxylase-related dioxygenase (phytanoyl-CoA dioxygenase family)